MVFTRFARVAAVALALSSPGCSNGNDATPVAGPSSSEDSVPTQVSDFCRGEDPNDVVKLAGTDPLWAYRCRFNPFSSISTADLNGDLVPDVIVHATVEESVRAVMALDGSDGAELWRSTVPVMPFTNVGLADLNGDGVADVVVTGRAEPITESPVIALDGVDGTLVWVAEQLQPAWQNVSAPQATGDLNGDGVTDWLLATGGDDLRGIDVEPTIAGRLVVIGGVDGKEIGTVTIPDGDEIYSSPIIIADGSGGRHVVVGSGGEAFSGSLWVIPLSDVIEGSNQGFTRLLSGESSSFIAPVSVADVNGDGEDVVVAARLDGTAFAIDPFADESTRVIWRTEPPNQPVLVDNGSPVQASFTSPAIAQLDEDPQLEVVLTHKTLAPESLRNGSVSKGPMTYVVLDGASGELEGKKTVSDSDSMSSPLTARRGTSPLVLCSCVTHSDGSSTLGFWNPSDDSVDDIGLTGLDGSTPAIVPGADGTSSLFVTARDNEATDGSSAGAFLTRIDFEGLEVTWGAYLGSSNTGSSSGP